MRTARWNEKTILEGIKNMAAEDVDGIAYSSKAKAGMRFAGQALSLDCRGHQALCSLIFFMP